MILRIRSRFVALLSVIAVALPALACGEYPGVPRLSRSDSTHELAGGPASEAAMLPPANEFNATSSGLASSSQIVIGNAVRIELRDFELVPSDLTVPAGEVTFTLINAGRYTHDFRVEGENLDEKSPRISAGRTGEWKIKLEPGVYRISCPISNHADRGMVGTLTVTP